MSFICSLLLSHPSNYVVLDSHLCSPVQPEPLPRSLLELPASVSSPLPTPIYFLTNLRGFIPIGLRLQALTPSAPSHHPGVQIPLPSLPPPHSWGLGFSSPLDFFLDISSRKSFDTHLPKPPRGSPTSHPTLQVPITAQISSCHS